MATARTKFFVGLFVIAGLCASVITIIALGMTKFLDRGTTYVTFFDESVQGLSIDSPVKYRGVPIGRVSNIQVAPDSRLIQVVMDIDKDVTINPDAEAQLSVVGITGSMFINLDIRPRGNPSLSPQLTFTPDYPLLPSTPSDITHIKDSLAVLYKRLLDIDITGISQRIISTLDHFNGEMDRIALAELAHDARSTLQTLNTLAHNPAWVTTLTSVSQASHAFQTTMQETTTALTQATSLLARVDSLIAANESTVNATLNKLHQAATQTTDLMAQSTAMIAQSSETVRTMQSHLLVTMQNLEKASRELNQVLEALKDQPSRLIMGAPPQPRLGPVRH
ncbi:MAG: hypothetical protein CSA21_02195 [Deltaproteobacteria bacterium]|nr:MAG: hypothetical protein CSA21_02195 [Deltaproteobacteria bacterium]